MMKMVIKYITIVMVAILAVLVIGEGLVFGTRVYLYMTRQNFDFQTAVQWTWDSTMESIKSMGKESDDEPIIIEMVNKNIDVVACTAL